MFRFDFIVCILSLFFSVSVFAWGQQGHRLIADIATEHLTKEAREGISRLLMSDTLADISNWPDRIKSKKEYRKYSSWHYCTVKDGESYSHSEVGGSIVVQLNSAVERLKKLESLPGFSKRETLAWVVHLVGDLHQPLHVGRPGDKGGNKIIVSWYGDKTNLHRLWDSQILRKISARETVLLKEIRSKFLSKELFEAIPKMDRYEFGFSGTPEDWATESVQFRKYPYDMIEGVELRDVKALAPLSVHNKYLKTKGRKVAKEKLPQLGEAYFKQNKRIVLGRIAQAGIRLANVLNEIYGVKKRAIKN